MRLSLIDTNPDVADALARAFAPTPEVHVSCGDLLERAEGTVVSPANSQGFMDGGIDRRYVDFFGTDLETRVRDAILRRDGGTLPVGASLIVQTGHSRIPYLIVATTMTSPEHVDEGNAYRALRAVLRIASQHATVVNQIFCPGLCTGVGLADPMAAARNMAAGYLDWKGAGSSR
jgi:O-acetyl-ADP-ribose deacetylase (regulator of RNase III)